MPAMSNDDLVKSCPTLYPSLLQVVHSAGERVAALLPPVRAAKSNGQNMLHLSPPIGG